MLELEGKLVYQDYMQARSGQSNTCIVLAAIYFALPGTKDIIILPSCASKPHHMQSYEHGCTAKVTIAAKMPCTTLIVASSKQ